MSIDNLSVLSRRRDIDLVNDTPSSRFTTSSSIVRSVKPSRPLYVQTSAYAKGIPRCSSFVISAKMWQVSTVWLCNCERVFMEISLRLTNWRGQSSDAE
jgi:hypothetical protein